ncbi:MAG: hypothetical protein JO010_14435 [Alphaproteobacteria bacterium]|nr:hypothetical protein [Alphaproteobacteria bacterium]
MTIPVHIRLWPKAGGEPDDLGIKQLDEVPHSGEFEFEHDGVLIRARAMKVAHPAGASAGETPTTIEASEL